jgi:hypothetical protein
MSSGSRLTQHRAFGEYDLQAASPDGNTLVAGMRGGASIDLYDFRTKTKITSHSLISGTVKGPPEEQEELIGLETFADKSLFGARVSFVVDHMYLTLETRLFTCDRLEPAGVQAEAR